MVDIRIRAFAIALYLAVNGIAIRGQAHGITLVGQLFQSGNGDCQYFTDPEGDSLSITLGANSGDYLCDWLDGTAKHGTRVVITITPTPKE